MKSIGIALLFTFLSSTAFADVWCERQLSNTQQKRADIMKKNLSTSVKSQLLAVNDAALKEVHRDCAHVPEVRKSYCDTELTRVNNNYGKIIRNSNLDYDEKLLLLRLNYDDKVMIAMAMTQVCDNFTISDVDEAFASERAVKNAIHKLLSRLNLIAQAH